MNKTFSGFWLLASGFWLFLSGCDHDPLLERTGANYFPLAQENTWVYLQTQNTSYANIPLLNKLEPDTIILKVTGTAPIQERDAWLLERNGCPEYWYSSPQSIDKFYLETIFMSGEEDTIISRWLPWLHLPFVLGEIRTDTFKAKKIIPEDTIHTHIQIDYEVVDLRSQDYKVKIRLIKNRKSNLFGSYDSTIIYEEWYSQNIGLTERIFFKPAEADTLHEKLISYSLH